MRKLFYLSMAALMVAVAACEKAPDANNDNKDNKDNQSTEQPGNNEGEKEGDNKENPASSTGVIGVWRGVFEDGEEVYTFKDDKTYSFESEFFIERGTFTDDGKAVTLSITKMLTRDWQRDPETTAPLQDENGNYLYTDWEEKELSADDKKPYSVAYQLNHQNEVLLISTGEQDEMSASISPYVPFLKSDAKTLSNLSELEGKWYWLSKFGDEVMVRCVLIIKGDQAEYIITPWSERYTGKVTYDKGVLTMASPAYTTARYEDPENPEVYEHINEQHPEDSPWRTPTGDPTDWYGAFMDGFRIAVVLGDDGQLYSIAANLPANYTKQ